jgi:hypothetical protein
MAFITAKNALKRRTTASAPRENHFPARHQECGQKQKPRTDRIRTGLSDVCSLLPVRFP